MTTPAKPARLSEESLRGIRDGRCYMPESREAARECLRLRRALRRAAKHVIHDPAGAALIIARALDATKGGK